MISYDYDKEVDVLYITWGRPRMEDDTYHADNDVCIHVGRSREIYGLTILNASWRPSIEEAFREFGLQEKSKLINQAQKVLEQVIAGEIALMSHP